RLAAAENPQNLLSMRVVAKCGVDSRRVYYSEDSGISWRLIGAREGSSYSEWTNLVALHPKDQRFVWAGGVGLQRGFIGQDWIQTTGTHSDHHQMGFDPEQPERCYVSTDGGLFASVDFGKTWSLSSFSLTATQFYSLGVSQGQKLMLGGATQ